MYVLINSIWCAYIQIYNTNLTRGAILTQVYTHVPYNPGTSTEGLRHN